MCMQKFKSYDTVFTEIRILRNISLKNGYNKLFKHEKTSLKIFQSASVFISPLSSTKLATLVVPHYKYCHIFYNTTITSILFSVIIAFLPSSNVAAFHCF